MNQKLKKISYKLYLTLQGLVILIGTGTLIWNLIAGVHDIQISNNGRACAAEAIGTGTIESFSKDDSVLWTVALENYSKSLDHPSKLYALKTLLERKCSDYLRVSIYEYSQSLDLDVYTKNYMSG